MQQNRLYYSSETLIIMPVYIYLNVSLIPIVRQYIDYLIDVLFDNLSARDAFYIHTGRKGISPNSVSLGVCLLYSS